MLNEWNIERFIRRSLRLSIVLSVVLILPGCKSWLIKYDPPTVGAATMQRCGQIPEPLSGEIEDWVSWSVELLEYADQCSELNDAKRDVIMKLYGDKDG
jgi:hypothetical protein